MNGKYTAQNHDEEEDDLAVDNDKVFCSPQLV
jgi:hypothetical protein